MACVTRADRPVWLNYWPRFWAIKNARITPICTERWRAKRPGLSEKGPISSSSLVEGLVSLWLIFVVLSFIRFLAKPSKEKAVSKLVSPGLNTDLSSTGKLSSKAPKNRTYSLVLYDLVVLWKLVSCILAIEDCKPLKKTKNVFVCFLKVSVSPNLIQLFTFSSWVIKLQPNNCQQFCCNFVCFWPANPLGN